MGNLDGISRLHIAVCAHKYRDEASSTTGLPPAICIIMKRILMLLLVKSAWGAKAYYYFEIGGVAPSAPPGSSAYELGTNPCPTRNIAARSYLL